MPDPIFGVPPELLGRDGELQQISWFADAVSEGPAALVFEGEPGIGKTTLWSRAVSDAAARGHTVLVSRPAAPEARLSFTALGDLLRDVGTELVQALPRPQRRALDVALLREEPRGAPPDWRAVGIAVVGVLSASASDHPTVVAVDDLQWVDRSSSRVLEFALRRVRGTPIGVLAAARTDEEAAPVGLTRALPTDRVRDVHVGPLSGDDLDRLIRSRLDITLPAPALRRLHRVSGGNPFFALEIARAEARGEPRPTGQSLPIPKSLRDDLLRHHLSTLPASARDLLLVASAASRPTVRLLERTTGKDDVSASLAKAVAAGIVVREADSVAFTHPLFGAAVYSTASREHRHLIHRRLAEVVEDPEERARHLALAADAPDEDVASPLEEAARRATARGASDAACDLYELALRLTPAERPAQVRQRRIDAAASQLAAGDHARGMAHLERALAASAEGAERAEVLWLLARAAASAGQVERSSSLLHEALEEQGAPSPLRRSIHSELALVGWELGILPEAEVNARHALEQVSGASADPLTRMRIERNRAIAAAAGGDIVRAAELLGGGLRSHDLLTSDAELGRTLILLGTLRRRAKQKRAAREALHEAIDVFEGLGAPIWTQRARAEAARIAGRRPGEGALTPAERGVAALAAAGRTNREIAETLFMSVRTVEGHLSHVFAKLGTRSRTELALFFDPSERPPIPK
jgi:DNA-binding CsgD family transcriptional regulator